MKQVPYGDQTLYQCEQCPRNFLSASHADAHMANVHGAGALPPHPAGSAPTNPLPPPVHTETTEGLLPPPQSAPKADWVDYAASMGVDTDGLTKKQLIERTSA